MGYNLTNERIQDTYEQLVQVSGSTLLDGTGSAIAFTIPTASYAVTASYANVAAIALNAQNTVSSTTFNAYTSSNDASVAAKTPLSSYTPFSSSVASQLEALVAGSGSADWDLITNKPSGLVSSSTQTLSNISGKTIAPNTVNAANVNGTLGLFTTNISGIGSFTSLTASNGQITNNLSIAGNISVSGTASIGYLQSVTGSARIIGDAFIILNNDTPTQALGGISVVDSGSTATTSSFLWDGNTNDWKYQYHLGSDHENAVALFASGSTIGTTVYPTLNKLQKGGGNHHLYDSNISDNGSQVSITGPVSASTYYGDGSNLTGVSSTLVAGTGANSIITKDLGDSDAVAQGNSSIAIGGTARVDNVNSTEAIAFGHDATVDGIGAIAIGGSAGGGTTTYDYAISIGKSATAQAAKSIAIGSGSKTSTAGEVNIARKIAVGGSLGTRLTDWTGSLASTSVLIGKTSNDATLVNVLGTKNVQIGTNVRVVESSQRDNVVAIGADISCAQGTVSIGQDVQNNTDSGVAIGRGTRVYDNYGIAIGYNVTAPSANSITIGDRFKYDGSSVMTLAATTVSSSGNLEVAGQLYSPTFAGSIASSTSSIDFNSGNFATLNCASSTFLANPSNLKSGTTYTLIVTNGANISGYGTTFKFAGGTAPTLSAGTDVITMVSDGTSLYATALADFQ